MAQETACIKGTRHGLVILLDPDEDFGRVKESLQKKIESSRDFFSGASFSFQGNTRRLSPAEKTELESLCLAFGLIPRRDAAAGSTPHRTGASTEDTAPGSSAPDSHSPGSTASGSPAPGGVAPAGLIVTKGLLPKENDTPCLLLDQGLRSGQRVDYKGHITVMGDVNPGAELVATGNVLVLGNLRGIAHAGASGDTKAVVAAYRLAAEQLRIADVVARSPEQTQQGKIVPEVARIRQGRIVVEPF